MPESEKLVCPKCDGVGYLYDESTFTREPCNCKLAEYMVKHLGTEIARAETIFSSPLFELADNSGEPPKLDRTKENLFVKCGWVQLLPHLKLCLWPKGIFFKFRVVTDEKIKTVFVGAESYTQRAKGRRDDIVTYNTLGDLVGSEFDFLIIRLGHLGHKNVAAAGSVKEALMLRDVAQKPTWIIEDPECPFDPYCFTYSEELRAYIDRNFKTVNFDGNDAARQAPARVPIVGGVEDVSPSAPMPPRGRQQAPWRESSSTGMSVDDDLAALDGSARPKKSKYGKKSGGGPV